MKMSLSRKERKERANSPIVIRRRKKEAKKRAEKREKNNKTEVKPESELEKIAKEAGMPILEIKK